MIIRQRHSIRLPLCVPKATVALLLLTSAVLNGSLFLSHCGTEPSSSLSLSSLHSSGALYQGLSSFREPPEGQTPALLKPQQPQLQPPLQPPTAPAEVTLPRWMTTYLAWHAKERRGLNPENWQETRYLVVRCLRHDMPCGGLADRLRFVPLALWIAAQTNRLLLIHWELPAPLQEFLEPPPPVPVSNNSSNSNISSLDWRIPAWLLDRFQFETRATATKMPHIAALLNNTNSTLVDMNFKSYRAASIYYNTHAVQQPLQHNSDSNSNNSTDPDFNTILRPVWNLLFIPSPPVAKLLSSHFARLHLQPGQYAAAHARTLYHDNLTGFALQETVENAVNCAAELWQDSWGIATNIVPITKPRILVASDSLAASQLAVAYGRGRVVSQTTTTSDNNNNAAQLQLHSQTPLHLDRGADYLTHHKRAVYIQQTAPVASYYNVFVDIYLLANSRCVTYDRGGFGKLGSLLSTNASCIKRHQLHKCRPFLLTN
jgi:hypothetical protein